MRLFNQPIRIKNMTLKNRLVMPPMYSAKCTDDGFVTEALLDYYAQRVRGGCIGLVITEHSYTNKQGKAGEGQLSLADDNTIAGMKELANLIHAEETKVIAQINHAGSGSAESITGMPLVSASAVNNPGKKAGLPDAIPHALTVAEILKIEDEFAEAAVRAQKAGFDGVEIHSAHGYLLNQFYSPLTNHRTDAYGVSTMENRTRIHVETIRKVRAAVGNDYPVAFRFGGCDYMEGGSVIEDAVAASRIFEAAGIDLLDLTGGLCRYTRKDTAEPGYFGDLSAAVRGAVSVPVILTGGIHSGEEAERLLAEEKADMIGVGRALLQNPDWARNTMH